MVRAGKCSPCSVSALCLPQESPSSRSSASRPPSLCSLGSHLDCQVQNRRGNLPGPAKQSSAEGCRECPWGPCPSSSHGLHRGHRWVTGQEWVSLMASSRCLISIYPADVCTSEHSSACSVGRGPVPPPLLGFCLSVSLFLSHWCPCLCGLQPGKERC